MQEIATLRYASFAMTCTSVSFGLSGVSHDAVALLASGLRNDSTCCSTHPGGREFLGALRLEPPVSPVLSPRGDLNSKGSGGICSHAMSHPVGMKKEPSCYNERAFIG